MKKYEQTEVYTVYTEVYTENIKINLNNFEKTEKN